MITVVERNRSEYPVIDGDALNKINEILRPLVGKVPVGLPEGMKLSVTIVLGDTIGEKDASFVICDIEKGELFATWANIINRWIRKDNLQPLEFEDFDKDDEPSSAYLFMRRNTRS